MTRADWELIPDAPTELPSPWATLLTRGEGDLYREAESGRTASLSSWRDRFARHHERGRPLWRRTPAGIAYVLDGDRFAFLWPVLDVWSAGHDAAAGERDGQWLVRSVGFDLARRSAEEWVMRRRAARVLDVDARLGLTS